MTPTIMRVSGSTNPTNGAGALAGMLRGSKEQPAVNVELHAVGASSVNQAVKIIAIARGFLAQNGKNLVAIPGFKNGEINGDSKTIITFGILLL